MLQTVAASAHDVEAANADGVTIYYKYINDGTELAVTYKGYSSDTNTNRYTGHVAIPSEVTYRNITRKVTSIGYDAFSYCPDLTSVTIGNGVTSISKYAFFYCTGMTSVTIPNSVTSIGDEAFHECSGLTSVHITDMAAWCNIKFGDGASNPLTYAHQLYLNGAEVKDLVIPDNITSIGNRAFSGCLSLTSVTIPNCVTSIGNYAFFECSGLTSVTIPSSVRSIGNFAFYGCAGLTSATIGSGVTSIGGLAFIGSNLKKTIWLTDTPPSGYENASGAINYVANNQYRLLNHQIVYPLLSSVFEADGIKYVPVSLSEHTCDAIDCVYDSSAAKTSIASTVSYEGVAMTVKNIQPYTCYNNQLIESLTCDNDGDIAPFAFQGCTSLDFFSFGSNVKTIGREAFSGCTAMTRIVSHAVVPPVCGSQALDDINKRTCTLSVPKGMVSAYQQADQWKEFFIINEDTGISTQTHGHTAPTHIYDLNGRKTDNTKQGLNIIRMSDGTTKKVLGKVKGKKYI